MNALLLAALAGYAVHLLTTAVLSGWRGYRFGPAQTRRRRPRPEWRDWLVQAGLGDVALRELIAAMVALALVGGFLTWAVLGAAVPALVVAACLVAVPAASARVRRDERRAAAQEAWPRLLEELRILTQSLGRSIPQALFDVGRRGPEELRDAFARAEREWSITTDFDRTLRVLKRELADPTADAACETLLVAHGTGGADLDARLSALIEDRIQDTQGRKDARARQAGARFARRFVVLVPAGMALAGMSVGNGRAAYGTPNGQALTVVAIALVVACWLWAGRFLRLPETERVFHR